MTKTYLFHRTSINHWWVDASLFNRAEVRAVDRSHEVHLVTADNSWRLVFGMFDDLDEAKDYAAYVNGVLFVAEATGGPLDYTLESADTYGANVSVNDKTNWFDDWRLAELAICQVMAGRGWSVVDVSPDDFDM